MLLKGVQHSRWAWRLLRRVLIKGWCVAAMAPATHFSLLCASAIHFLTILWYLTIAVLSTNAIQPFPEATMF